jgi:adenosylcobyric acid synthase
MRSHVVVMGQPYGHLEAGEFASGRAALAEAAFSAYDDLRDRFDVVICEGAGSPAEINLRRGDFVNMGLSRHGGIPTVVVGDIDRGGVFASFFGTLALLDEDDQRLVAGFVVNKFRGDLGLLQPGLDEIERLTGRPVLGVLPWRRDLWLDSEDSLATAERPRHDAAASGDRLRVAVVVPPRISNVTDIDALCLEPALDVSFVDSPRGLASADLVVLPGTRATIRDLSWLRSRGLADAVVEHSRRGGAVLGICGGFQMLGREVADPDGIEGPASTVPGLGLLDARTVFTAEKVLRTPTGVALGVPAAGYEIHHGRVEVAGGEPFLDGVRSGSVFGTMWHGSLEGDALRARFLQEVAALTGHGGFRPGDVSFAAAREQRIELLADLVEEHLDLTRIVDLIGDGPPELPALRAGLNR